MGRKEDRKLPGQVGGTFLSEAAARSKAEYFNGRSRACRYTVRPRTLSFGRSGWAIIKSC
jgi:hypothetical protein